ncbi:MAG: Fe-Mn family superoxide dismutase [Patescibacteria group bacterium]
MYTEQSFSLENVTGLSPKQLEVHLKLYAGYVKNTNAILAKVAEYKKDSETHAIALSELMRRFGFEFNGMRLHELYFESLGGNGETTPRALVNAIIARWGSFDVWKAEFQAMGVMRGIGWVLLVHDPKANTLHNVWVSDHELGHFGGLPIIIAMDVWEHAFMVDYLPAQRNEYIQTFFKNLNWNVIEKRYNT